MVRRLRKKSNTRRNTLLLLPIGVAVVALIWSTLPQAPMVDTNGNSGVNLQITMKGWAPDHFEAKVGVPLNVTLSTIASERSMSDSVHSFILNETGTKVFVTAGDTKTFSIVFPHEGTYTFWCLTCCGVTRPSSEGAYMSGTVTVT